jgi:hypothetical protein
MTNLTEETQDNNNFDPAWYVFSACNTEALHGWFDNYQEASQYLEILGDQYQLERLNDVSDEDDKKYQQLCVMTSEGLKENGK